MREKLIPYSLFLVRCFSCGYEKDPESGFSYALARYYSDRLSIFTSTDPMWYKYPSISPYAYCANNPVRFIDPTGKFPIETIWDIGNVLYDVGAAVVNHIKGDHKTARSHWGDAALDAGAMFIPYVPAGTSKALKAGTIGAKALDKAADVGKATDKVIDVGKGSKTFDGGLSTNSKTSREAFRKAKDANGVPRSQQPDTTTTVREKGTGKPLKQYEFTNSKGEIVQIRKDNPKQYGDGGKGDQGKHFNAGSKNQKLKQHHNYDN